MKKLALVLSLLLVAGLSLGLMPPQRRVLLHGGLPGWILSADGILATVDQNCATNQGYNNKVLNSVGKFWTVSRATPATTYAQDLSGNWISFPANTLRQTNQGCLVEESRTNLFLNSTVPVTQSITVVSTSVYTVSLWGTGSLVLSGAGTGTVTQGSPITFTAGSTTLTVTTTGITGSFINAQVELGASATSPINTAGSSVTRSADVINLNTWSSPTTAVSVYARIIPNSPATYAINQVAANVSDGTTANRLEVLRPSAATTGEYIFTVASTSATQSGGTMSTGVVSQVASSATSGSQGGAVNGTGLTDSTQAGFATTMNTVEMGSDPGVPGQYFNGYIQRLAVWRNYKVSDVGLVNLTSGTTGALCSNSLNFSQACNSQYLPVLF